MDSESMVNMRLESGICVRGTWQTFCPSGFHYFGFTVHVTALILFTQSTFYLASSLWSSKLPPDTQAVHGLLPLFLTLLVLLILDLLPNIRTNCCPRLDLASPQILLMFWFLLHSRLLPCNSLALRARPPWSQAGCKQRKGALKTA